MVLDLSLRAHRLGSLADQRDRAGDQESAAHLRLAVGALLLAVHYLEQIEPAPAQAVPWWKRLFLWLGS